jgi:hypothetical protein
MSLRWSGISDQLSYRGAMAIATPTVWLRGYESLVYLPTSPLNLLQARLLLQLVR